MSLPEELAAARAAQVEPTRAELIEGARWEADHPDTGANTKRTLNAMLEQLGESYARMAQAAALLTATFNLLKEIAPMLKPKGEGIHAPYITTMRLGTGHAAVMIWWNPDMGGFLEPWDTGIGRYATQAEAEEWGRSWAEDVEVDFRPASTTTTLQKTALNPKAAWPFPDPLEQKAKDRLEPGRK